MTPEVSLACRDLQRDAPPLPRHGTPTRTAVPASCDSPPQMEGVPPFVATYRAPRHPKRTLLYTAVRGHNETFLENLWQRTGHRLPRYCHRERNLYLRCGVLAYGFSRVCCSDCANEELVPFSCKRRGICPSCTTRRALDAAHHLTDHVLPKVAYHQWVFTVPWRKRLLLAQRPQLLTKVLDAFTKSLFALLRHKAKRRDTRGHPGAFTCVQRFSSALRLNVHFHGVAAEGVKGGEGASTHSPSCMTMMSPTS